MIPLQHKQLVRLSKLLEKEYDAAVNAPGPPCVPNSLLALEATLHEFSHAAVFGLIPTRYLSADVGEEFEWYGNDYAADLSECKALAIELEVATRLGLHIEVTRLLYGASSGCRQYSDEKVWAVVLHYRDKPFTLARATRVVGWLQPHIEEVQRAEALQRTERQSP